MSNVIPLDPVARSMQAHPSSRQMPDELATKARLMVLSRDDLDSVLWFLAGAHPGIVDAAIKSVRGEA